MTRGKRNGWTVRALAAALAAAAMPATGAVPESVNIPLMVVQIPGVGVKVGIQVSLGGGPPQWYTFDTGSSGFYAAYNSAWWPAFDPLGGPPIPQSYGSGLALEANRVSTTVGIPTDQGEITFKTEVGQITKASGTSDGTAWLDNVAAGKAPLYGLFFGDFGSGLTKKDDGLFAVLPQLPGNLSSGFAVQLGCNGGGPESKVVVGLTDAIRSRVTSWVKMTKHPNSPPLVFPHSHQPVYEQALFTGNFSVAGGGASYPFSVPAILDTGGGTTGIHQQPPQLLIPDALVVDPGAAETQIISGAQFRVTAAGTTAANGFDMSFVTGTTATINQVNVAQPKSATTLAEVNLGLVPFFRYDVVFDVAAGNVGFAPCTASATSPIPTLSAWATALLAAGLACLGALAAAVRAPRRLRRDPP